MMYTPVTLRFLTYEMPVRAPAIEFVQAVDALPAIHEWRKAAAMEPEALDFLDNLAPANEGPLTLG